MRDFDGRIVSLLDVTWVSADLHRRALERLFRMNRQVSLVDAVSFTAMDAEGISEVLGLDTDFVGEGFRLVP